MPDFLYIQSQKPLDCAIESLKTAPRVAIDTESSGYYTYFSELCLIQISSMGKHYVIDPLSNLKLDGLGEICKDPGITKIFHSAASDIVELKRAFNWEFHNIFDTFLACRLLGHASCSLASLVIGYEGVELEKKEQKSNWKQRPLSRSQLEYAHLDTVYLESLVEKLKVELDEVNMYTELAEEFERLCSIKVDTSEPDVTVGWQRISGAKSLSPQEQAMLRELYLLRDKRGRKENIAPFRILSNPSLLWLVRKRPDNLEKPLLMKSAHPAFVKEDGVQILKILKEQQVSSIRVIKDNVKTHKLSSTAKLNLKHLKKWRRRIAEYRGIDPSMVIGSRGLDAIVKSAPKNKQELEALDVLGPWKMNAYGQQVLDIIANTYDGSLPEALPRLPQVTGI